MMIGQKNLGFFGQSLAQAWFRYQRGLLHDDWAKKPWIWAVSAFETAQIQGFWSQSLGQAWFPTQGRLLHVIGQKTLDLGRIGVRNSPDPGIFGQKLGRAWFSFQKGLLLHDDWPKKP